MSKNIAIIGAGLSGAILYKNLKKKNYNIKIFEKSRGAGGRCSTRYIKALKIDHGTSAFQVTESTFKQFCEEQVALGVLEKNQDFYKGVDGINKMVSSQISDRDMIRQTKIIKAYKNNAQWTLEDENQNIYSGFDILLCTIPATQLLELNVESTQEITNQLQKVKYDAVGTLITYGKPLEEEQIQKLKKNSFFRKISTKQNSTVFHVIAQISNKLNSKEEVQKIISKEIQSCIGVNIATKMNLIPHLWRYGFVSQSLDTEYIYDEQLNLGTCGDYFKRENLESSFLSSTALSKRI